MAFESDPKSYFPVVGGKIIREVEGLKIIDTSSCHVVGDKVNGVFKFNDGSWQVIMNKRVKKLE